MKPVIILLVIIIVGCKQFLYCQNKKPELDTLVKRLGENFLNEKDGVGLSIAVLHNGSSFFYNFGTIEKGKGILPTPHAVFEIGSITKTFVSYVLANAIAEGKLTPDDDVRKYMKGKYPNLAYGEHPIKIIHLANTTSTLPDWLPAVPAETKTMPADAVQTNKIDFYKGLTRVDFFNALKLFKPDTIPGSRPKHSNAAAQLLAYILEDVYQMPMERLIERYVTGPAGMKSTGLTRSGANKALLIGYNSKGENATYEHGLPYFAWAGGLTSTSNDLLQYMKMLLHKQNTIAKYCLKKTVDIDVSNGTVLPMKPDSIATPELYSVGLNWMTYHPDSRSLQAWTDGGTNGFNSYLVLYPFLNAGVVLLANKSDEKIFRSLPGIAYQISKHLSRSRVN